MANRHVWQWDSASCEAAIFNNANITIKLRYAEIIFEKLEDFKVLKLQ